MGKKNEENNKLFAEYMGLIYKGKNIELQYHKSWDWLMPVIHKLQDDFYKTSGFIPERMDNAIFHHLRYGGIEQASWATADLLRLYLKQNKCKS